MRMSRKQWMAQLSERGRLAWQQADAGVAELLADGGWQRWLTFAARMPDLSFTNQLLLWTQCPNARLVLSAQDWQAVGRWPTKGAQALRVWSRRPADSAAGPQGRPRFVLVPVFDLSQTDGDPVPVLPVPGPPAPGRAPRGLRQALEAFAAADGITVRRDDAGPGAQDVDQQRRAINATGAGSEQDQVLDLAHGIGRRLLHCGEEHASADVAAAQADSIAFLVAAVYSLDTSRFRFDALPEWARQQEEPTWAIKTCAEDVHRLARRLLPSLAEHGIGAVEPHDRGRHAGGPPPPPVVMVTSR